jgi:hypothetical protein
MADHGDRRRLNVARQVEYGLELAGWASDDRRLDEWRS